MNEELKKIPAKVQEILEDNLIGTKRGRCIRCDHIIFKEIWEQVDKCEKCGQALKWE